MNSLAKVLLVDHSVVCIGSLCCWQRQLSMSFTGCFWLLKITKC